MLKVTRITDPVLAGIVDEELDRQEHNIEMIASESTVPVPVMELSGSVFTNKTLEGYPGSRFQAGSHIADKMEKLAIERAKAVYGAEYANIQSYSGSTANYSV
ncbi:MAG: serine hydroxymethyltransferase, partial [Oscillospiraceae bacterium]